MYDKIVAMLRTDLEEKSVVIRWIAWKLKLLYEIVEKFWWDNCPTFAASLAYTTLLALAPLAAVSLSIFSSFEYSKETVLNFVFERLLPNEGLAKVIEENIDTFADNAASVSIFGLIALVIFSIWVMSTVESAFNMIWKVKRSRPILNQFVTYWSIITFAPILITLSMIATAQVQALVLSEDWAEYGYMQSFIIKAIPYLLTWVAFFLIYRLAPYTTVYFKPAWIGAMIGGTMFEMAKLAFDYYLRNWASYTEVYGALATIPIFLFWLYVTWLIVLLGSVIAYAIQYPKEIHFKKNEGFNRSKYLSYYALRVLMEAARSFQAGLGPLNPKNIQKKLEITGEFYGDIIYKLRQLGLVAMVNGSKNEFLFKIPPANIKVADLLLNLSGKILSVSPEPLDRDREKINEFFENLKNAINLSASGIDLLSFDKSSQENAHVVEIVKNKVDSD